MIFCDVLFIQLVNEIGFRSMMDPSSILSLSNRRRRPSWPHSAMKSMQRKNWKFHGRVFSRQCLSSDWWSRIQVTLGDFGPWARTDQPTWSTCWELTSGRTAFFPHCHCSVGTLEGWYIRHWLICFYARNICQRLGFEESSILFPNVDQHVLCWYFSYSLKIFVLTCLAFHHGDHFIHPLFQLQQKTSKEC